MNSPDPDFFDRCLKPVIVQRLFDPCQCDDCMCVKLMRNSHMSRSEWLASRPKPRRPEDAPSFLKQLMQR
jgi:hypothetical protein